VYFGRKELQKFDNKFDLFTYNLFIPQFIVLSTKLAFINYYPHMPIGKVWIYRLLFVILFFCLFVRLRISPTRIKLAASNFAGWFRGVLGRESPILGNFAAPETQNRTNRPPTGSKVKGGKSYCNRVPIKFAPRVDEGSVCVDIRPSQKTDVLVFYVVHYAIPLLLFRVTCKQCWKSVKLLLLSDHWHAC